MWISQVCDIPHVEVDAIHWGSQLDAFGAGGFSDPGGDLAQVDLGSGNTGLQVVGWVESSTLNVNSPCDDLLVINL